MKSRLLLMLAGILVVGLAVGLLYRQYFRTVDGRTASRWLEFARHTGQQVAYHAEGRTVANGTAATFTLDQDRTGRYVMRVTDAHGRNCTLGFDGKQTWFDADGKSDGAAPHNQVADTGLSGHILGTGAVAGRPVVHVAAASGKLVKEIAIDRRTGVPLAMTTTFRGRQVSRMTIERIEYRDVAIAPRTEDIQDEFRAFDPVQAAKAIGGPVLHPQWLPEGYTGSGTYLKYCDCCNTEMVVQRYANGLTSFTLFQSGKQRRACGMGGGSACATGQGCRMTPTGNALVATRTVNGFLVTAVGNVDPKMLDRVLNSLK